MRALLVYLALSNLAGATLLAQSGYHRLEAELRAKYSHDSRRLAADNIDHDIFLTPRSILAAATPEEKTLDKAIADVSISDIKVRTLESHLDLWSDYQKQIDLQLMIAKAPNADVTTYSVEIDPKKTGRELSNSAFSRPEKENSSTSLIQVAAKEREALAYIENSAEALEDARKEYAGDILKAESAKNQLDSKRPLLGDPELTQFGMPLEANAVLLQFQPNAQIAEIEILLQKYHLEVIDTIEEAGSLLVRATPETFNSLQLTLQEQSIGLALRKLAGTLRKESIVRSAARNILLGHSMLPRPSSCSIQDAAGAIFTWDWCNSCPHDGNYAQKRLRLPAAWNFVDAIKRHSTAKVRVGLIDAPLLQHEDLDIDNLPLGDIHSDPHGNVVAGVLFATFDNGLGIDGFSPFITIEAPIIPPHPPGSIQPTTVLAMSDLLKMTYKLIREVDPPRVINFSNGYNWAKFNVAPLTDPYVLEEAPELGKFAQTVAADAEDKDVIIVSAAGNDSAANYSVDAEYGNPFNWAALHGDDLLPPASNIIIVESLDRAGHRATTSNAHGHISAPGEEILTLGGLKNSYLLESGTSLAAPEVTGTIALMLAYNPSLKAPDIIRILNAQSPATAVPAPMIDSFNALLASRPGSLHDLADFNGDGAVDMKDFRIFRAALHQMESDHPRNYFPRADLNGDGILDRQGQAGVMGRQMTDLQVMTQVWEDLSIPATALPGLLDSNQ